MAYTDTLFFPNMNKLATRDDDVPTCDQSVPDDLPQPWEDWYDKEKTMKMTPRFPAVHPEEFEEDPTDQWKKGLLVRLQQKIQNKQAGLLDPIREAGENAIGKYNDIKKETQSYADILNQLGSNYSRSFMTLPARMMDDYKRRQQALTAYRKDENNKSDRAEAIENEERSWNNPSKGDDFYTIPPTAVRPVLRKDQAHHYQPEGKSFGYNLDLKPTNLFGDVGLPKRIYPEPNDETSFNPPKQKNISPNTFRSKLRDI